jgi:uncharacterized membrane protein YcaP (DUF421 family)
MDAVLRAVAVYVILMVVFRVAGKRALAQITTFDFILLLIISESIQNALVGQDFSLTNALLLVVTLVGLDIGMSLLKQRSKKVEKLLEGTPLVIVEEGRLLEDRMQKARVDEGDILTNARQMHGLECLEQIQYAVLERNGGISIIPKREYQTARTRLAA